MKILIYFPGIGEIGAATLIAEIDNLNEFSSGDKLAFYWNSPGKYINLNINYTMQTHNKGNQRTRCGF